MEYYDEAPLDFGWTVDAREEYYIKRHALRLKERANRFREELSDMSVLELNHIFFTDLDEGKRAAAFIIIK